MWKVTLLRYAALGFVKASNGCLWLARLTNALGSYCQERRRYLLGLLKVNGE